MHSIAPRVIWTEAPGGDHTMASLGTGDWNKCMPAYCLCGAFPQYQMPGMGPTWGWEGALAVLPTILPIVLSSCPLYKAVVATPRLLPPLTDPQESTVALPSHFPFGKRVVSPVSQEARLEKSQVMRTTWQNGSGIFHQISGKGTRVPTCENVPPR